MNTAVIVEKHQVAIQETAIPELKDDEVLIKVLYAGLCGSDVHLFHDAHPFRKPPMIPGHELAGEIAAVGPAVRHHRVGDRVVVNHAIPCGECRYCKAGQVNICPTKIVAGSANMMGFFAEYVNVPERTLYTVALGISMQHAAIAEPLSIGFHIMRRLAHLDRDEPIAIVGTGTIGLVALIAAKSLGYTTVYGLDTMDYNLDIARQLGATATFNPLREQATEAVLQATGGLGTGGTIITAMGGSILTDAFALSSLQATLVMLPMTAQPMEANFFRLVSGEQSLIGCRGIVEQDFADAVGLINSGYDFGPLITHILPLSESQRAFELMVNRMEPVIKILIAPPL
ncbi:alcohol dehydrogenase catalytic domain-containing protein [Paenibacillus sp. IB182496]|uniref:Alcohol dehydrogenase catalytic domain-containing protein n=1 Tax=Paenibacillus sabuli TaxID=2772509 RepID=A0A927BTN0_9BACL|nr:alcohol dehydrogenase catalytic domain-containing protein [Paenibacillus sabuli]MBD2846583.1 alcohol dehydrogenase catalytic domain-containing protein [Paenibacillus sabuli]